MVVEEVSFKSDGLLLEGELCVPENTIAGCVIAHPHPQHGGNMKSITPGVLFNDLPPQGIACLRFNFRGIGNSEGQFGGGYGELNDLRSALDTLNELIEGLPIMLAGWSFGADTALCLDDPRVNGWFAVAPPLRNFPVNDMKSAQSNKPKHLCVPQNDEFCPPDKVRELTSDWVNTGIFVVPGADHFLVGRTQVISEQAISFINTLIKESQ